MNIKFIMYKGHMIRHREKEYVILYRPYGSNLWYEDARKNTLNEAKNYIDRSV